MILSGLEIEKNLGKNIIIEPFNRNQLNSLKDNMLFISIEDNKDKIF